ncbi:hypothetical protein C2845_PM16G00030 [Panicum miliaceum]|uniref:Uncharacterized protein n=1 Tax=Panicum miliaceum TaxID=4540 RepID=A0A3L6Q135_PANMI|nr:hypothetical protein C2845_PM16G00030 [Panicum miliaceum]
MKVCVRLLHVQEEKYDVLSQCKSPRTTCWMWLSYWSLQWRGRAKAREIKGEGDTC